MKKLLLLGLPFVVLNCAVADYACTVRTDQFDEGTKEFKKVNRLPEDKEDGLYIHGKKDAAFMLPGGFLFQTFTYPKSKNAVVRIMNATGNIGSAVFEDGQQYFRTQFVGTAYETDKDGNIDRRKLKSESYRYIVNCERTSEEQAKQEEPVKFDCTYRIEPILWSKDRKEYRPIDGKKPLVETFEYSPEEGFSQDIQDGPNDKPWAKFEVSSEVNLHPVTGKKFISKHSITLSNFGMSTVLMSEFNGFRNEKMGALLSSPTIDWESYIMSLNCVPKPGKKVFEKPDVEVKAADKFHEVSGPSGALR